VRQELGDDRFEQLAAEGASADPETIMEWIG